MRPILLGLGIAGCFIFALTTVQTLNTYLQYPTITPWPEIYIISGTAAATISFFYAYEKLKLLHDIKNTINRSAIAPNPKE